MGDNRGLLAKWLESRAKLSGSPFKPQFWSLNPTDRGLMRPDYTYVWRFVMATIEASLRELPKVYQPSHLGFGEVGH